MAFPDDGPNLHLQLQVEQHLGDFAGYSGSAVVNEDGQVTGLLISQKFKRTKVLRPEASDVLYALPIFDVAEHLSIKLDLAQSTPAVYLRESFASLIDKYTQVFAGREDVMGQLVPRRRTLFV